jgi:biotin transport system substrate-specific component
MKQLTTTEITLASMFVALMAIGANITSMVPFMTIGGVPITLQTFFAILAGLVLGSRLGAITMIVYTFVGLVGVPVFSKFGGGISTVLSPTFGFILSFILTAYVTGKIAEKNKGVPAFVIASLTGMAINYLLGTNWMYFSYKLWAQAPDVFSYKVAWGWMLLPGVKDIIFSVLAALMGHRLEKSLLSKGQFKHLKRAV